MTSAGSSRPPSAPAPVLVLGVGNLLLHDDGVGLELLELLRERPRPGVEYVDGGTQGIALGAVLAGREAALVLDAVERGAAPGTVHRIDDPLGDRPPRGATGHEANVGDLLSAAALLGDLPERVVVVGVEPQVLRTEIGLSDAVRAAVPAAVAVARGVLEELCGAAAERRPCTS